MIEWLSGIWEGLVQSTGIEDARERYLSRILNSIVLVLVIWGAFVEGQYRLNGDSFTIRDVSILITLAILGLAYYLNHGGHFLWATILTLALFVSAIFVSAALQYSSGIDDLSVLYYMIIAILIGELLLSLRGYLITVFIILAGVFGFSLLNSSVEMIFLFLFVFCELITFSSYNRRSIELPKVSLARMIVDVSTR